ncbi:hypothetical protein [Nocardia sp. NPDC051463]|uniref:hypothetical protein n=1 Tax=Nocardia sp. NPDC051463 TaxID=3154845 RepID=UPI00342CCC0E
MRHQLLHQIPDRIALAPYAHVADPSSLGIDIPCGRDVAGTLIDHVADPLVQLDVA